VRLSSFFLPHVDYDHPFLEPKGNLSWETLSFFPYGSRRTSPAISASFSPPSGRRPSFSFVIDARGWRPAMFGASTRRTPLFSSRFCSAEVFLFLFQKSGGTQHRHSFFRAARDHRSFSSRHDAALATLVPVSFFFPPDALSDFLREQVFLVLRI